jgi:hypothetical protein
MVRNFVIWLRFNDKFCCLYLKLSLIFKFKTKQSEYLSLIFIDIIIAKFKANLYG